MKNINLKAIRIDGGTHRNYVVEFADGRCKFGVTRRLPTTRARELQRKCGVPAVNVWVGPAVDRTTAFQIEADAARLLGYAAIPGTREWQRAAEDSQFDFISQTVGMFWHLRMPGSSRRYSPEVISL